MEGMHILKEFFLPRDLMCEIDLKSAYFKVSLHPKSRKYVRFLCSGSMYKFLCLCFGLGLAPLVFTKLIKIPISLLRKLSVRIVVYLTDMLLMSQSLKEVL